MYTFILGAGRGLGKSLYEEILIKSPNEKIILSSSSIEIESNINILPFKCNLLNNNDIQNLIKFISDKQICKFYWVSGILENNIHIIKEKTLCL